MKKRKVIIDCDPGIDDSLAIMLALKSPEIEVIGITIVCGNSPVEMGFGNAKKILFGCFRTAWEGGGDGTLFCSLPLSGSVHQTDPSDGKS